MKKAPEGSSAPLMLAHGSLQNLFVEYLGLSLHAVRPQDIDLWHELVPPPPGLAAVQFEVYLDKLAPRYRAFQKSFLQAQQRGRAIEGAHAGLAYCVAPAGDYRVIAASYQTALPTAPELRRDFAKLSGRAPGPQDELYLSYCRSRLDTPLLNADARQALASAVEAAAAWYGRSAGPRLSAIEALKPRLAQGCSRHMERYAELRRSRLLWWAASARGWAAWDARDFQSQKAPNAVLAFGLAEPALAIARDEALARAARLRQACFEQARERHAIVGRALGEGACLLVTCPFSGERGRAWMLDQARSLSRALQRELGVNVCVGVSRPHSEEGLPEAFRQADWSLLMGLQRGQAVQGYEEGKADRDAALESFEAGRALQRAVLEGQVAQVAAAREALLGSATRVFPGREDLQRPQLLQAVLQLFEALHERGLVEGAALEAQRGEALRALREAQSPQALAQALSRCVDALSQAARSPRSGASRLRVESLRRSVKEEAAQRDLASSARLAGVSPSRFSRLFKAGGAPFGAARRQQRLEQGAELLRHGALPVWRVAQECGYRSASHFSQAFQRVFKLSPAAYRRKLANKP